jgi:hypothetical protein
MRERYLTTGTAPSIRSLGKESGVPVGLLWLQPHAGRDDEHVVGQRRPVVEQHLVLVERDRGSGSAVITWFAQCLVPPIVDSAQTVDVAEVQPDSLDDGPGARESWVRKYCLGVGELVSEPALQRVGVDLRRGRYAGALDHRE